jgi:tRNA(Ile2)-agmatinylcytidine synthase
MQIPGLCYISIGLDDFDALKYGCTTHLATYILNELPKKLRNTVLLFDYPNLVRLNPSIPWKTRGNGAIAIRLGIPCEYASDLSVLMQIIEELVEDYINRFLSKFDVRVPDFEPGLVIARHPLSNDLASLYEKALTDVVVLDHSFISKLMRKGFMVSQRYGRRGIIGASAAIMWLYKGRDYTFELLTYRSKKMYGKSRCIDEESVKVFDNLTRGESFNNYDYKENRILITPHGLDPILYGVRGETPDAVKKALSIIKVCEPLVAWTVFRSNQATDDHAIYRVAKELNPFKTCRISGVVAEKPAIVRGGTVIVKMFDATGEVLLAFFKPSQLFNIASVLDIGDYIEVQGQVKLWNNLQVVHVEKIAILNTSITYKCRPPKCPRCGKRMEKKGLGKGYKCEKCGIIIFNPELECKKIIRGIAVKLSLPPPHSQKHLMKPIDRYGKERNGYSYELLPVTITTKIIEPLEFL